MGEPRQKVRHYKMIPSHPSNLIQLVFYTTLIFPLLISTITADVYNGYNAANTIRNRQGNENSPIILPNYYHSPNDKENRAHEFWAENEPKPHFHGGRPIDYKLHQHFGPEESDFPENHQYITDPPGIGLNKNRLPCKTRQLPSTYDEITPLDDGIELRLGNPYDCHNQNMIEVTPSIQKIEYDDHRQTLPYPTPDDLPNSIEEKKPNPESNWPLDTNSNYDYDSNNLMAKPIDCYGNSCDNVTPKPTIQDVITRKTKIPLRIPASGAFITHPSTLEFIRSHTTESPENSPYDQPNLPSGHGEYDGPNAKETGNYDAPNRANLPEVVTAHRADHKSGYNQNPSGYDDKSGYSPNSSHHAGPPGAIPPEENTSDSLNNRGRLPSTVRPKIIHRYYNDGYTTRSGGSYYMPAASAETPFTAAQDLYTSPAATLDYGSFGSTVTPGAGFGENSQIASEIPNRSYDSNEETIFAFTTEPYVEKSTGPIIESGYEFHGAEPSSYDKYPKKEVTDESYPGVGTPKPTPPTTTESRPPYVPPVTVTPSYNPYDGNFNYKHNAHPPGQEPPYEQPKPVTARPPVYQTTYNYRTTTPHTPSTSAYSYTTPTSPTTTTADIDGRFKTVLPQRNAYPPGQAPTYEEKNSPKASGSFGDGYDVENAFKHPHPTPPPTPPRYVPPSTTATPSPSAVYSDAPTTAKTLEYSSSFTHPTISSYENFDSNEAPETILALSPTPFSVIPTTTTPTTDYRVVTVTARAIASSTTTTETSTTPKEVTVSTKPDVGLKSFVKTGHAGGHNFRIEKIEPQTTVTPKPPPTVYSTVGVTLKPRNLVDHDINIKETKAGGHVLAKECCACCADDPRPKATAVPRKDDVGYAVTPTVGPAPGASPWFAPGGGPFPWAGGSQGCGGPCQGNPKPCCGPEPPKPCCPSVPNCCQTPCCPKISLPCCPQQSLCCDQGYGCGQCRSRAALRVRTKRTLCLPCNGRKKRDVFDEIIHSRQKRLACQFCSRKKRQTCQTCSPFQQSIFSQLRSSMDTCSHCPTLAHRKKREAEIKEYYELKKNQSTINMTDSQSNESLEKTTIARRSRQVHANDEQCDASCCDFSKCQRNSGGFNSFLRKM
uniref:Serine proteinase stubble n=2 Tax=Bursaphelenchus xylophilus TaxID=6326 RepID=A0A1I7RIH6_BURXY